jgi:eukaryotic-like serine/threonine-protein kinase
MLVGQTLGPFYVDRELGHGAMGTVYRALEQETNKPMAIKVIGAALASNPTVLARFEREAKILKQLKHPNIVRLYGTGRYHKTPFYVMEYIEGETLQTVLERRGRFTWEEVVDLGKQVCSALQHAHHQGIIHRDLKPSNIMITPDGTAKLTDFGIAKGWEGTQLTATNSTVGTASYMSPEQCRGEKNLTHKSDLYSLGVVFYELLTGRRPFEADSALDMFLAHTKGSFERPARLVLDIPIWLDTLVCQLMEKKPEHRPFDAVMVASALDQVQERVAAKKSAGVELLVTPSAQASTRLKRVDESDQEAARLLRAAAGKKTPRRKTKRFYERAWFQGPGILALLSAIVGLVYFVTRPADPHQLFLNAQPLMETNDWDQQRRARDGPIKAFLRHYADRNDEEALRMFAWADQVDLNLRARQLQNRLKFGLSPEGEEEQRAFAAVRNEDAGDLTAARERWQKLLPLKEADDRDERVWGLLAEKRIRELDGVDDRAKELRDKLDEARRSGQELMMEDKKEEQAARALHFEVFGDIAKALDLWKTLRDISKPDSDRRQWFLLAVKKVNELTPKASLEENLTGLKLVRERLSEAEALRNDKPLEAAMICRDVLLLYGKNSEMAQLVKQAQDMLEKLSSK